jgi:predicted type IV restriction endonuclease
MLKKATFAGGCMLHERLKTLREKLNTGTSFSTETAVRQGLVLPLLYSLGWDVHDTDEVVPEYSIETGGVDYALRTYDRVLGGPQVYALIETKQLGRLDESAETQLFAYAFHKGVPLIVLTDGREWRLYRPQAAGSYAQRLFAYINILEDTIEVCADKLGTFLSKSHYKSVNALDKIIEEVYNQRKLENALLTAWEKLQKGEDESLIRLIQEKVSLILAENSPEVIPAERVKEFLRRLSPQDVYRTPHTPPPNPRIPDLLIQRSSNSQRGIYVMGEFHPARSFRDMLEKVLTVLENTQPGFLYRFYRSRYNEGNTRRYIAPAPEELFDEDFRQRYPNYIQQHTRELILPSGERWWLMVNVDHGSGERILQKVAQFAGLPWGTEKGIKVLW